MRVKICGVTTADNAAEVAAAGADFLGLNFWPRSKRYLPLAGAAPVVTAARQRGAALVGLFVDPTLDELRAVQGALALDVVQLHGDEAPEFVAAAARALGVPIWKAIPLARVADVDRLGGYPAAAALVIDAPSAGRGGSGQRVDPALLASARSRYPSRALVLAGGLTAANVAEAMAAARPWAVDVASGVEDAPGHKDPAAVRAFVEAARCAAAALVLPD